MKARWKDYVSQQLQGSQRELADRAGVSQANISRWLSGSRPSPEEAIKFARGVGLPPVQALAMANYITAKEADTMIEGLSLGDINEVALLDELRKRAIDRLSE